MLGPEHFDALDPLALGGNKAAPPFDFPDLIRRAALQALEHDALPVLLPKSRNEQRAIGDFPSDQGSHSTLTPQLGQLQRRGA
jgi:hypothetical protein